MNDVILQLFPFSSGFQHCELLFDISRYHALYRRGVLELLVYTLPIKL